MEPLGSSPSRPSRGSFDDVYRANGSGLLSVASSSSLALSAVGDKRSSSADLENDDNVDDTNMSDGGGDAIMSDTSSLDIEDRDSAVLVDIALDSEAMDLLLDEEEDCESPSSSLQQHRQMTLRSASFHGALPGSPRQTDSPRPPRHRRHVVARAVSLGSYTPSNSTGSMQPLLSWPDFASSPHGSSTNNNIGNLYWPTTSPRKRKPSIMWLHSHFALAMTKSVARTQPHPQLAVDSHEDDDLMTGNTTASNTNNTTGNSPSDTTQRTTEAKPRFPRVEWASDQVPCYSDREGDHLVAAKGQVIATQLRVLSNDPFQLTTDRANWFLPQGHTPRCRVHVETSYLPQAIHVETFNVGYVEDERGDRMMETLEKRTSSQSLQLEHAIFLRIRVRATAIEGNYEIPVRLFTQHAGFTDEVLSWSTSIHVRVAAVTLPPPSQWKFHLDLWQHHTSIARAHGGVPLWSDAHFTLIDRYMALLAELGQKCVTIVATEMPWAGQMCYNETNYPSALFEHAVLDVYDDDKSDLVVDFQHFDRLVALADKHDMAAEIEVFGILSIWKDPAHGFDTPVEMSSSSARSYDHTDRGASASDPRKPPDSWRIRCTNRTTQRVRYLHTMAEIESFITQFYDHCVACQLVDRVRICADEPSELAPFYAQMAFLERLAPHFKVKVALNHLDFLQHAPPQVVDFVPLLPLVCADLETTRKWEKQIHELKKGKFCWYVCCVPGFPNQFVSSPLAESELLGFLTHFMGLDGFLRWNFCLWPAKPWDDLKWRSANWKVGDMYFVLPGLDGFPVETLRLEALRVAIQSYELLQLAQRTLSENEFARLESDIAELIWRSPGHAQFGKYVENGLQAEDLYSLDAQDYERARRLVIDALALATSLDPDGTKAESSTMAAPLATIRTTTSAAAATTTATATTAAEPLLVSPTGTVSPRKRSFRRE